VKRALAYTVTGIVLGIAIMFIPLIMFIPSNVQLSTSWQALTDSARKLGTEEYTMEAPGKTEQTLGVGGGVTFQLSLLHIGLIFAVSLLSALGVYGLFKRRLMG